MKYLCLIYMGHDRWEKLSERERETLVTESLDYDELLREKGHFIAAQALEPANRAVTLRAREGQRFTTDGPFAETKEQLCGFILVNARDLNEAMQIAAQIPVGRLGAVEVRPVAELERPK